MDDNQKSVTITDVDIPFWRLVVLFVQFGFAAIPAAIVVSFILGLLMMLAGALFGLGMHGRWMMW